MFEKVNPMHPDKVADRIAGAIVDMAYAKEENPKIAVEVLIGHRRCFIILESSVNIDSVAIRKAVERISGRSDFEDIQIIHQPQDPELAKNQSGKIRVGDNGIFKGVPTSKEESKLSEIAHEIYEKYPTDGKYVIDSEQNKLIVCQSYLNGQPADIVWPSDFEVTLNPLGPWTGGIDVDTGATNRKLGSDMGRSVTGGGLHGKDLSKADVSVNIYAFLKAQKTEKEVELSLAIGDEKVDGKDFSEIVTIAKDYIKSRGGFEKFAEWGLI